MVSRLAILLLLFSLSAFSQIVSPSFNTGTHTELASASALRKTNGGGLRYISESGTTKSAYQYEIRSSNQELESSEKGFELNGKIGLPKMIGELRFRSTSLVYQRDESDEETDKTDKKNIKLNVASDALLGFYLGASYEIEEEKAELIAQTINQTSKGLSVSRIFLQNIIFSYGLSLVDQEDTKRVDNSWPEHILGLAYVATAGALGTRGEIGLKRSPEAKKPRESGEIGETKTINHHAKSSTLFIGGEARMGPYLGSLCYQRESREAVSTNTLATTVTDLTLSGGYFLLGDKLLGTVSYRSYKLEEENEEYLIDNKEISFGITYEL